MKPQHLWGARRLLRPWSMSPHRSRPRSPPSGRRGACGRLTTSAARGPARGTCCWPSPRTSSRCCCPGRCWRGYGQPASSGPRRCSSRPSRWGAAGSVRAGAMERPRRGVEERRRRGPGRAPVRPPVRGSAWGEALHAFEPHFPLFVKQRLSIEVEDS